MALLSTSCGTLPRPSRSVSGQLSSTSCGALTISGSILELPRLRARAATRSNEWPIPSRSTWSTLRCTTDSGWPYSRHYELGQLVSGLISGSVLPLRLCVKTTASGAQPSRSPGDSTRAPALDEWPIPSRSTWSTHGCTTDVAASPKQKVPSMPRMALRRRGGGDDEMGDVSVHPNATDGPAPLGLQRPGFGESTTLAPPNSAPSLEDVLEGGACAREGDTWHGGSGGSRSLVGPTDCPADCDLPDYAGAGLAEVPISEITRALQPSVSYPSPWVI